MDAAPSPVAITDDSFLSPTGALLSADTERVSDGLLFQLLGKVGRRRHKGKSYRKKHAVGTQKNHPKQRSAAQSQHSFALLMIAGFLALIDVLHLPVDLADGLAA